MAGEVTGGCYTSFAFGCDGNVRQSVSVAERNLAKNGFGAVFFANLVPEAPAAGLLAVDAEDAPQQEILGTRPVVRD